MVSFNIETCTPLKAIVTETVQSVGSAVVHACAEPERGAPATHVSLRIAGLGSLLVRRGVTENRGPARLGTFLVLW